jgi:hypothetical protein
VIAVDAAQTWAVIGVLAAAFFGTMALIPTMFTHVLRTEIGSVRTEIGAVRTELRAEIGAVRTELGGLRTEMNARFESVDHRLDGMDRDIQLLMNREFGADRG